MSKINCPCGNQLSDVCYPYKHKGTILSETEVDSLENVGIVSKRPKFVDNAIEIILNGKEIWECPECGRLAVVMEDDYIQWYLPTNILKKRLFV